MNGWFETDAAQFCLRIMETLDVEYFQEADIEWVLSELCGYFDFACGFIYYQTDHKSSYRGYLAGREEPMAAMMPGGLELNSEAGEALLRTLAGQKLLTCFQDEPMTALRRQLQHLLGLDSFVLAPILNEDKHVIALIGLGDSGMDKRMAELNLSAIYSIFVIILNHIKVWHYSLSIERTEKALEIIANNMGVDIYVNDFDNHDILYLNESMAAPYGGVESMIGRKCWQALYDDKDGPCEYCPQKELTKQDGGPNEVYSWDYQRPFDKSWFRVLSAAFRWEDGRMAHIVSSIDITDYKKKEELIRIIAEYDTLTGLSNRRKLFGDGEKLLERSRSEGRGFYVLFFDLNKFKQVNDQYGHRAGDELLGLVGAFLQECELTSDYAYRYGGDEFVLLLHKHSREEVLAVGEVLQERFNRPWSLTSCEVACRASIGISEFPVCGSDMDELLHAADEAMYEAKSINGKKVIFYENKMFKQGLSH